MYVQTGQSLLHAALSIHALPQLATCVAGREAAVHQVRLSTKNHPEPHMGLVIEHSRFESTDVYFIGRLAD